MASEWRVPALTSGTDSCRGRKAAGLVWVREAASDLEAQRQSWGPGRARVELQTPVRHKPEHSVELLRAGPWAESQVISLCPHSDPGGHTARLTDLRNLVVILGPQTISPSQDS